MTGRPKPAALALVAGGGAQASAAVLYDQTPGAGTKGVPSQESPDDPAATTQAADDFVVPDGQHWALSAVEAVGSSSSPRPVPSTSLSMRVRGAAARPRAHAVCGPWSRRHRRAQLHAADPGGATAEPGLLLGLGTGGRQRRRPLVLEPAGGDPRPGGNLAERRQRAQNRLHGMVAARILPGPARRRTGPGVQADRHPQAGSDQWLLRQQRPGGQLAAGDRLPGCLPPFRSPPSPAPAPNDLPCPSAGKGPCQLTLNEDITIYGTYQLSNEIRFGKLKRNLGDGSAKLFLGLRAASALSLTSHAVRAFREGEAKPGTVRVPLVPKGAAKQRLARTGRARVALRIKFRASGNNAETTVRRVTLRQKLVR